LIPRANDEGTWHHLDVLESGLLQIALICCEIFDIVWEFCVCGCEFCASGELGELIGDFAVPAADLLRDFAAPSDWAHFARARAKSSSGRCG
jgi:hypothetical protein